MIWKENQSRIREPFTPGLGVRIVWYDSNQGGQSKLSKKDIFGQKLGRRSQKNSKEVPAAIVK